MARIVAISDQHGQIGQSTPGGDVLCILGDSMPLFSSAERQQVQRELDWATHKYDRWIQRESVKYEAVIYTGSNHDCLAESPATMVQFYDLLRGSGVTPSWRIVMDAYGEMRCDPVGRIDAAGLVFAAYNLSPTIQQRPWPFSVARGSHRQIREGQMVLDACEGVQVDVLLSHAPPAGILDLSDDGTHCGCGEVARILHELCPRASIHGHIHEERARRARVYMRNGQECKVVNCSIMDRMYRSGGGRPIVVEI